MAAEEKKEGAQQDVVTVPLGAAGLPTIFADTFFLSYSAQGVKMMFGESIDSIEHWRSAIMMPIDDVTVLVQRLTEALDEMKKRTSE
jgi:hypothetical protein